MRTRVALLSKPRSETEAAPAGPLWLVALFWTGTLFEFATVRFLRSCSTLRSPDLLIIKSRLRFSTGFRADPPTAVGIFDPGDDDAFGLGLRASGRSARRSRGARSGTGRWCSGVLGVSAQDDKERNSSREYKSRADGLRNAFKYVFGH